MPRCFQLQRGHSRRMGRRGIWAALAFALLPQGLHGQRLQLVPGWPHPPLTPNIKLLTLVRHAEGLHNKDYREMPNYLTDGLGHTKRYWDAPLTADGEEQARRLSQETRARQENGLPELIAVSPMTRALQTAHGACARNITHLASRGSAPTVCAHLPQGQATYMARRVRQW